jgi:flagellar biosynthesis/type III secretory pathway protein FliH
MNFEDHKLLVGWLAERTQEWPALEFARDPDLQPGDLRVDVGSSSLDLSLQSQLDRIRVDLQKLYEQNQS